MQMPVPGPGHAQLSTLAGTWEGPEVMEATPFGPASTATGHYVMRAQIGGFFVLQDYVQMKGDRKSYEGHGVFAWDEKTDTFTWYWVDTFGGAPNPSRGKKTANGWVFESVSDHGNGRYTYEFLDANTLSFRIENKFGDGPWTKFMAGTYSRKA